MQIEKQFNDLNHVIEQCKARKKKRPGSIWTMKILFKDWVIYFVTVLKIDDDTYRFFDDPQHAKDMRVLRGLDEYEEERLGNKLLNQYKRNTLGDYLK